MTAWGMTKHRLFCERLDAARAETQEFILESCQKNKALIRQQGMFLRLCGCFEKPVRQMIVSHSDATLER